MPNSRGIWLRIPQQARWLAKAESRLVVCGHVYLLPASLGASRLAGATVGTVLHGMELVPRRWPHRVVLALLPRSSRVVAVSRHTGNVARLLGVPGERIRVVNPAPAPPWPVPDQPNRRSNGTGLHLVAVSRLAEGYKNIELLLRMVSVLRERRVISRLTVIGDGPRRGALETRAQGLGVEKVVQFVGRVEDHDVAAILADAHIGLFPSRHSLAEGGFEGFGLVIQEMASAGLPVLVGRAAGAVDAARPGWSVLLDPDDLRAWTGAIEEMASDEPKRVRMAESALAWSRSVDHRRTAHAFLDALTG
ncbi:MAG: glycosyltransferase [Actinomycetota bacterium]|nr:glycosyltransferase [Actinomycetota bacterium]